MTSDRSSINIVLYNALYQNPLFMNNYKIPIVNM